MLVCGNRPQTQSLKGKKTAPKLADSDALEWMIFMGDSCEDRLCDSRVHVGWSQLFLPKAWRPSPLETRVPFLDSSLLGQPLVRGLETESPPLKQESLSLDSSLLGEASELGLETESPRNKGPFPGFLTPSPVAWRPSPLFSQQVP